MNNNIHEILSEIHHVLSIASAEELRAAANLPSTSPNIQQALHFLAAERAATSSWNRSPGKQDLPKGPQSGLSPDNRHKPAESRKPLQNELSRLLQGFSKREIVELARSMGIEIQVREKESRERVILHLSQTILAMPPRDRDAALNGLGAQGGKQTEGWVDVVRRAG